ncbi:MAG: hypothetical protein LH481_00495 [Burkholderiales bacterium]|nr:hypothetical protein [Burkholderiales bacterium]
MNSMSPIRTTTRPESVENSQIDTDPASLRSDVGASRVLRNTYALLSMMLLFSAAIAAASVARQLLPQGVILTLGCYFGLLFVGYKFKTKPAASSLAVKPTTSWQPWGSTSRSFTCSRAC